MKTKHLHDMVIEAILKRGAVEVPSKTRKYRTFAKPAGLEGFYFVGKAGALRVGRSASSSQSLERGAFYKAIQEAYHDQFPQPDEASSPAGWVAPEAGPTTEELASMTEAGHDRYARGGN